MFLSCSNKGCDDDDDDDHDYDNDDDDCDDLDAVVVFISKLMYQTQFSRCKLLLSLLALINRFIKQWF